jgi:hypothetical protein
MKIDPDQVDRVQKLLVDADGMTFQQAADLLRTYRAQLLVAADRCESEAWQAAVLTAVNAGVRAMHGGVRVMLEADPPCACPLFAGRLLSQAVADVGGEVVAVGDGSVPTVVFGTLAADTVGDPVLYASAGQWRAVVGPGPADLGPRPSVIAAVASAGLAVSECFQRLRGFAVAADRTVAMSLWQPGSLVEGPPIHELIDGAWLLGLGHLGQAYAWLLALLPYANRADAARRLILQDDDRLTPANRATSMLEHLGQAGVRKTRLVAAAMDPLGWDTALVERRYAGGQLHQTHDPSVLLAGVDNPEARHRLDETCFDLIVDAGLGAGPDGFLDMTIRRLPGARPSSEVWPVVAPARDVDLSAPGYRDLRERYGDGCGVERLAGRTVATAFVGVVAACWTLGLVLRELHGQTPIEQIDFSLRNPGDVVAIRSAQPSARIPGVAARPHT